MSDQTTQPSSEKFLTVREVEKLVKWSRQHISREERAGRFPKRVQMGPNSVRWPEAEILAWMDAKKRARAVA